ncbi:class I SAM-dependent methyltransferase [Flagellimonas nanhaiensis]|uniref:SAM-dependent methyltransferase n=1 Tax=Flagellimonas nanhaiensis TaxID=2292706 RepID=A0A371JQY1_9FLAO|nr:class I SAM-dependent methyltransferase [Allomuricauda nanhaiensis]RDY59914.1 SAM-dependent methyltransferase [Allomuricauda nanhaiensis]
MFLKNIIPGNFKEKYNRYKTREVEQIYKGNKVTCPICNSSYSEFGTFGKRTRKNAKCHKCGSLERHRLVWCYLNKKRILREGMSILHFAPEEVFYNIFSKLDYIEYFPCDLKPDSFTFEGNIPIAKVDITDIPYKTNAFDFILCNHVLEHIPNDERALSELFRVMKEGGSGIFQVPIDYSRETTYEDFSIKTKKGRMKAFGQHDHVRWYGRDYVDRLSNAGFMAEEDNFVQEFSEEDQFRNGFEKSERIYFCSKQKTNQ